MPVSRRLKVALIVYRDDPASGGALRVGQLIAQNLPADQVEAHLVFAYGGPGHIAESYTGSSHFLQAASARDWASWKRTRSWFKQMRFDLLHFIDPVNWVYFATLAIGTKRIDHFHGRPIQESLARMDQLISIFRRWTNDAGIAITHGAKKSVVRMGWMSPPKLYVVHNGVNLHQFEALPTRENARKALRLPEKGFFFGMVARVCDGNGVMEMLEVLKRLPTEWHGVVVGEGPLRPVLQRQAEQEGLADRLHLPGAPADVRPAYAALEAVIFLGRYQPFCLMLAEAMLAQRPVVGLQGAGEYTEHEYPLITSTNAILFPRVDPWDFEIREPAESYQRVADALQNVVAQPEVTRRRVQVGLDWVNTRFSAQRQAQGCLGVYRQVLGLNQDYACEH